MAPTPQELASLEPDVIPTNKSKVVISGVSGIYPKSKNVVDFSEILYNKVDPISTRVRWKYNHPELPAHLGSVPGLHRFDAQFFKVHYRLGNSMDSMSRKTLEQCYQAIFDAGLSPEILATKRVGVFVGACFSESEKASFYLASAKTGFGILGCSRSMYANRISYWLNLKGPSISIDEGCCSATAALEQAYLYISRGYCDAAIVGSASICLHPQSTIHNRRAVPMCEDGKTKSFDENADGCARSEAIVVFVLQRADDALRVYSEIVHVKSRLAAASVLECVTGQQYTFARNPLAYEKFLNSFYSEANISPDMVEYVEAFGSAVPEADKCELDTISKVFCQGRKDPLLVGSVMSNVGYTEASCGAVALTKVLLGYYKGELAANLHLSEPRKDIEALQDGRMRLLAEHQPFSRAYTAINNLSVTGCSAHILLKGHYKAKDKSRYQCSIPRLVTVSGRQESAAQRILDDLKSRPIDPEELALLHNVHTTHIAGHLGKAFTILDTDENNKTISLSEACEYSDSVRRPLWFVYSGMGSQWAGMGTQLMRIPIFASAIEKCHKVLAPKGVDLIQIITSPEKNTFDNILNSFVGIAAVQIGLTDILKELGLVPDKIIGHSVGELGCAYADGCFTAEEMILSAYSRGLVSIETPFIRGSMAAVGLGYQQVKDLVPPEIEIACHNAAESSTISGPADVMKEFVASLAAKGIFAKEVPCSNIAYHSRYIAEAGPGLLKYLSEVIKNPKPRSDKWVSTSVPMDKWDQPTAKYSSAHYHTNNLLNPVLFEETSKLIPPDAVLVEIAPHGLLQAILKRSLPLSCKHIPLTRRGHPNNSLLVLEAVGKLYMEGYLPKVAALYPKVEFPVSTETPMLAHLVEWAHTETWKVPLHLSASHEATACWKPIISVHDDDNKYLRGNVVQGKNVYPFAAALVAAWDTLSMTLGAPKRGTSVHFKDVHLFVQPTLSDQKELRLNVQLHRGTGRFEILHGPSKVATGYVQTIEKGNLKKQDTYIRKEDKRLDDEMILTSEDVYQMLYEREYSYSGDFRSIQCANTALSKAYIEWSNNWVTLLDGLLHLNVLRQNHDAVSHPRIIKSLNIDVERHALENNFDYKGKKVMKLYLDDVYRRTRCGGVTLTNVAFTKLTASTFGKVSLNKLGFVPHFKSNLDAKSALQVFLQIVSQNVNKKVINVYEIKNYVKEGTVFDTIRELLDTIPDLKVEFHQLTKDEVTANPDEVKTNADLVLVQNLNMEDSVFEFLHKILPHDTFLAIAEESSLTNLRTRPSALYRLVSSQNTGDLSLHLSRWRPNTTPAAITAFTVRSRDDFQMLATTRNTIPLNHKLLVLTSYPPVDGVKDLVAAWRQEPQRNKVHVVMMNYNTASDQDLEMAPEMDLTFNVLKDSIWGGEYYLPLVENETKVNNMTLRCEQIGDLNSLQWVEAPQPDETIKGITVDVEYAGLNTVDAKRATGVYRLRQEDSFNRNSFGMDFSGVTPSGAQVMGIVSSGACSKRVRANPRLVWPVPSHWTLEEAATVPLPYAHAFYLLMIKINMPQPGDSILIHGGTGALGQAAIAICLAHGMEVFATVSDVRKKRFLRKLFPDLKEDHIGCSRDQSFSDMVRHLTNDKGVNRVINCIPGDLKNESMKCTGTSGIVFDTVHIPAQEEYSLGMFSLTYERNYVAVDFGSIFTTDNQMDMTKIQLLISEGISRGYVRPLSCVTYGPQEAARALRLLGASRHRGRVLLRLTHAQPPASPSIFYSGSKSQLVVSDDATLGLQLVDRLVARGAKNVHLQLPNIPALTVCKQKFWKNIGAAVNITTEDLKTNVQLVLKNIKPDSLEGLYLVSSKTSNNKLDSEIVKTFDNFVRKQAKALNYFAVVSDDHSFGNETCYSRASVRLPATKLCLPSIKRMSNTTGPDALSWQQALDALDRALRSSQPLVFACPRQAAQHSLLAQITTAAGITIPDDLAEETTLDELGVTPEKAQRISVLLRDEHNLWLSEDHILSLTIQEVRELKQTDDEKQKDAKGLEVFFSYIDTDELMATIDMVFLPTLTTKNTEEFDVTQKYLCIVPGMEGNYERFRALSERLKLPALVLQAGLDRPHDTVRETAEQLATTLVKKAHIQNGFYLLGYESGVLVALELASILEEHGVTGTVYCIGSSPEEFQSTLEEELKEYSSEAALQEAVIRHLFRLMTGKPCDLDFPEDSTWQEKVEYCMRSLSVTLSTQYVRAHFDAAYGKIVQARKYKPQPKKLRSNIVLLETVTKDPQASRASLQKYSSQPIVVHSLGTPLANALRDNRVPALVNRHLHVDMLREFETKDLCETFTIKSAMFATPEELGIEIE